MKKTLSFLLALLLLLSVAGCSPDMGQVDVPQPTTQTLPQDAEMLTAPQLVGEDIAEITDSDGYTVQVSHEMTAAGCYNGEIISQAPVAGTLIEKDSVIYVIVNVGGPEKEDMTEPETVPVTVPVVTQPYYDDRDETNQTDPPRPSWNEQETEPPQTLPPQTDPPETQPPETDPPENKPSLDPNGSYTTKNDVALYIHLYGRLPNNFVTKNQAEDLYGWNGGSLSKYGMCIGGDRFYNNEGRLPSGYTYYECDIDTLYSSKRGAKRLVFTYSGIIYYTSDHYRTFTRLY